MKRNYRKLSSKFKLLVIVVLALLGGAVTYLLQPKPDLTFYQTYSTAIFDSNNKLLHLSLAQDDRYRVYTPIEEIAESLQQATILYEDQNYYKHSGVDYWALARAFWQTYILKERRIGASTIAMQVARLRWNILSNTPAGKVEQIFRALQLARHYSKSELLEAYLNLAPYGGNIEGIGAASLIYFNKPASQLSIAEALTLAVVPQNPTRRNPSSGLGMLRLQSAKLRLIERWTTQYPAEAQLLSAITLPLSVRKASGLPHHAPHFVQYILSSNSRRQLYRHDDVKRGNHIKSRQGTKTTLDLNLQTRMEKVLQSYISKNKSNGFNNASALLLNSKTMHIEAMIGSADFNSLDIQGQVNGTLAKRSPGSTLKPFVYALALDAGIIHPMTMLKDMPKRYAGFTPENFGKGFVGPISAQDALTSSRNVPAVDLQSQLIERKAKLINARKPINDTPVDSLVNQGTFYELLEAAGISQLKDPDFYGLALALGGGEVTMLELVELYAMIANFGEHKQAVSTYWVSAKKDDEKDIISGGNDTKAGVNLLSAEASYLIFDMLSKNPRPNRAAWSATNRTRAAQTEVAWKTGTSWAFRDAWAVGISGDYVLAVWIGNFDGQGNNAFVGRSAAGPLLFKLLDVVLPSEPSMPFDSDVVERLNLKSVDICTSTGDLYESECPNVGTTFFIPGVSPIKSTNIYRKVWVDNQTGLRVCDKRRDKVSQKVFAFWPTDFQRLFEQAGVYIERPPSFTNECLSQINASVGSKPSIYSPQQDLLYVVQDSRQNHIVIPLQANADADASRLHWFANNAYIGSVDLSINSDKATLLWEAKEGDYDVQVSDDLGRSSFVSVKVQAIK
ncbi:MAG: penicillin-binding protein 1C [Glaciecola sp.]|jgi:penicillin-binding protein 1C